MKKLGKRIIKTGLTFLAMLVFAFCVWAGVTPPVSVSATGAYDFKITDYEVEMTICENREVEVEEKIKVSFSGYDSHGIIRDFVLSDGVRYKNITAECDSSDFYPHFEEDDDSMLSLYLRGDGKVTGKTRDYTIRYTMIVPDTADGYFPLDVIGYDWQCDIENVDIIINLPNGLSKYQIFSGKAGAYHDTRTDGGVLTGKTLTIHADRLSNEGITLDLLFQENVLTSTVDPMVWISIAIGAVLIVVAIFLKTCCFKQPVITKTVNLTAPQEMDPLKMGKLIDNAVDGEDLGAMIFYLADQGYLEIDLSNEKEPILKRTKKEIAADLPSYVKTFLLGLFAKSDTVSAQSLSKRFYVTADEVVRDVSKSCKSIYQTKSISFIFIFGLIVLAALAGVAYLYARMTVGLGYSNLMIFTLCAFAYALTAIFFYLSAQYKNKWGRWKQYAMRTIGIVLGMALSLAGYFCYNAAFTTWVNMIVGICATICGCFGGSFAIYTKEHATLLGHILGFKQFILYTERDKIEFMLKDDPELFYHILPYAQVLGITDAWTDKFKGLDMRPPMYMYGNSSAFDFMVWNAMFRSMNRSLTASMISRPSSSGSGHNSGGFGGGFGGGGFGGGGGRGC